jgi:maltose alpha-D-glucosyltransferase/alpha-amylase
MKQAIFQDMENMKKTSASISSTALSGKSNGWLSDLIIYQIYPQSFLDTNGDGIGDLKGIESKLDYIKSIGVNAIWLNPCFASTFFDAGYDVTDYYTVAPRYGSNDDLRNLIKSANKKGLKVLLDLVPGHTSIEHPWFKESAKGSDNEYNDCYIWMNREYDPNDGPTEKNYLKSFFPVQPALNYGYAVIEEEWQQSIHDYWPMRNRRELRKIMKFWLDMGASGFRVDMASSLIKNDPDFTETNRLWAEIREWMEKEYPDSILVAEWSCPEQAVSAGFHIDFMIHFNKDSYTSLFFNGAGTLPYRNGGECYFDASGKGTPSLFIKEYIEQREKIKGKGYISLPTSNHDFQRLCCGARTQEQLRVPWVFFMTQAGIPTIYYGDEIGMKFVEDAPPKEGSTLIGITAPNGGLFEGERAGSRTPMQWNSSKSAGFSTAPPDLFYTPLDSSPDRPSVEEAENNPDSILHFVRKLIKVRQENSAFAPDSEIEFLNNNGVTYPLVYICSSETQKCIVALNPSANECAYSTDSVYSNIKTIISSGASLTNENSMLNFVMRGFSYIIAEIS